MGKTIHVEVTSEDIAKGKRANADCCPVALACRRAGLDGAVVADDELYWTGCNSGNGISPPYAVTRFVLDFDEQRPVEPFAFDLELP